MSKRLRGRRLSSIPLLGVACFLAGCGTPVNNPLDLTGANGTFTPVDKTASSKSATPSSSPNGTSSAELQKEADTFAQSVRSVSTPGSDGYKIGPQDVLEITVFKVPDLSKTVHVSEGGTINLPLVGEITASGKTPREVEQDLTKKLGNKFLQDPQVNVNVKDYNSQRVTVEGLVKKPGVFPIRAKNTLLQTLATAEGLTENADTTVVVFRQIDGKRSVARFDVAQIKTGAAEDPMLQAGDVVVVGNSIYKESYNNVLRVLPFVGTFALLASP